MTESEAERDAVCAKVLPFLVLSVRRRRRRVSLFPVRLRPSAPAGPSLATYVFPLDLDVTSASASSRWPPDWGASHAADRLHVDVPGGTDELLGGGRLRLSGKARLVPGSA